MCDGCSSVLEVAELRPVIERAVAFSTQVLKEATLMLQMFILQQCETGGEIQEYNAGFFELHPRSNQVQDFSLSAMLFPFKKNIVRQTEQC